MKQTILMLALAMLTPYAVTKVEDLKDLLGAAVEKQRRKSLIRWSLWGWKIRWSIRDRDVDAVLREIDRVDALTVESYIQRLVEALA